MHTVQIIIDNGFSVMNRLPDWQNQRFSHCSVLLSRTEWHRDLWITPPPIPFLQVASCINITDSSVIHNRGIAAHTVTGVAGFYTAPLFFSDSGARIHGLLGGVYLWSQQSDYMHVRAAIQEGGWEVGVHSAGLCHCDQQTSIQEIPSCS